MTHPLRVLIFYQRNWGIRLGHFLCERIQQEYAGATFAALVFKQTALDHIHAQQTVPFEKIWYWEQHYHEEESKEAATLSLDEIAEVLQLDSIWPLVQSMRLMVKNYSRKYYYAFSQSVSDAQLERVIRSTYRLVREMVDTFQPNVIVMPNFVTLPHLFLIAYAKVKGILIRNIVDTKIAGYLTWAEDQTFAGGLLHKKLQWDQTPVEQLPTYTEAVEYLQTFRQKFIYPDYVSLYPQAGPSFFSLVNPLFYLKMLELAFRRKFKKKLRDKQKIVSLDYLPPRLVIRDRFSQYRYWRAVTQFPYDPLPERFIYFPLQFQPEEVIDVVAPYFNNQLECARLTAQSMPGGLTLVVKDHPAMAGMRSPEYLYKLQHQPNIKLVDYRIPTHEILNKAVGVVTISGTTIIEAALLGIPCVQFSNLAFSLMFPHVRHCSDFTQLARVIKEHILNFNKTDPAHDRWLVRYIALTLHYGFTVKYADIWDRGGQSSREPLWQALDREIQAWFQAA